MSGRPRGRGPRLGKCTRLSVTSHERGGTRSERRPASREDADEDTHRARRQRLCCRSCCRNRRKGYRTSSSCACVAHGRASEWPTEKRATDNDPVAMTGSEFLREKSAVVSVGVVVTHQRAASVSRATRALAIGWRDARSRRTSRRRASASSAARTGGANAARRRVCRNRRHRPPLRPVRTGVVPRSLPASRRRPRTTRSRTSRPSPRRRRVCSAGPWNRRRRTSRPGPTATPPSSSARIPSSTSSTRRKNTATSSGCASPASGASW